MQLHCLAFDGAIHCEAVLDAVARAGEWQLALDLLEEMVATAVAADDISYNTAVCASGGGVGGWSALPGRHRCGEHLGHLKAPEAFVPPHAATVTKGERLRHCRRVGPCETPD